jgi:hypothetical protein
MNERLTLFSGIHRAKFVLFNEDRKYWIRLNTTIEHLNLPIDTWNVGNAAD